MKLDTRYSLPNIEKVIKNFELSLPSKKSYFGVTSFMYTENDRNRDEGPHCPQMRMNRLGDQPSLYLKTICFLILCTIRMNYYIKMCTLF